MPPSKLLAGVIRVSADRKDKVPTRRLRLLGAAVTVSHGGLPAHAGDDRKAADTARIDFALANGCLASTTAATFRGTLPPRLFGAWGVQVGYAASTGAYAS